MAVPRPHFAAPIRAPFAASRAALLASSLCKESWDGMMMESDQKRTRLESRKRLRSQTKRAMVGLRYRRSDVPSLGRHFYGHDGGSFSVQGRFALVWIFLTCRALAPIKKNPLFPPYQHISLAIFGAKRIFLLFLSSSADGDTLDLFSLVISGVGDVVSLSCKVTIQEPVFF